MATAQQQPDQRVKGLATIFNGVSTIGRKAQEVVGELTKLSEEKLDVGAKAAERLRDAKSIQDITGIQSDWIQSSYQSSSAHYFKIAEIVASTPQEVAKCYSELFTAFSHVGGEAMNKATEFSQRMGAQAANTAHETADAVAASQQTDQATDDARYTRRQPDYSMADASRNTSQPAAQDVRNAPASPQRRSALTGMELRELR